MLERESLRWERRGGWARTRWLPEKCCRLCSRQAGRRGESSSHSCSTLDDCHFFCPREGVMESNVEPREKQHLFFFSLSLFFKRMCLDFSPVPYKKKNTRNDWQINDFTCLSELILALRSKNVLKNNWRLSKNKGQLALIVDEINDFSISLK